MNEWIANNELSANQMEEMRRRENLMKWSCRRQREGRGGGRREREGRGVGEDEDETGDESKRGRKEKKTRRGGGEGGRIRT